MKASLSFVPVSLLVLLIVLISGSHSPVSAQQRAPVLHRVQVRIFLPDGIGVPSIIKLQLDSERTGLPLLTKNLIRETLTEFNFLPNGEYILTISVDDDKKMESYTEKFSLRSSFPLLKQINAFIKAKDTRLDNAPPGTISANNIGHSVDIPKDAVKAFEKGLNKAEKGKSEDAIKAFKDAIRVYPNYLDAINNLAVEYMKVARYPEATEQLKLALQLSPEAPLPHLNLGIVFNEQKQYHEAETELTKAIQLDFKNPLAHFQLGIACFQLSDFKRAQLEFEITVNDAAQKIPLSRLYLAEVYKRLSRVEDAINQLETFLKETEKNPYTEVVREELKKLHQMKS